MNLDAVRGLLDRIDLDAMAIRDGFMVKANVADIRSAVAKALAHLSPAAREAEAIGSDSTVNDGEIQK